MSKVTINVTIQHEGEKPVKKKFELGTNGYLLIGRVPTANICIENEDIPERLLYILLNEKGQIATSINGSKHEVLLNKERLSGMMPLDVGSIIDIAGITKVKFTGVRPSA